MRPAPALQGDAPLLATRRRLEAMATDLEAELGVIAEATAAGPDDEHDAEGSTVGFERARVTGLLDRTRRQLRDLDVAAARLADGTYQRCDGCGGPIGAERLDALPSTRRCAGCAQR